MPAVAVAAPEIAFAAILFACFMLYALAFYLRNTTADIVIVGGALAAALDWILDRVGELIAFFIGVAANLILGFQSFWHNVVVGSIGQFVDFVNAKLADFNFWIENLKTTVGPNALAALNLATNLDALVKAIQAQIATAILPLIDDIRNTLLAVKNQQFVDENQMTTTAATLAAVVGTGVLALPDTLTGLRSRIADDERVIGQQTETIAQQSAALQVQAGNITDLRNRVDDQAKIIERIKDIAVVTAVGAVGLATLARLARNPCLCFEDDQDMSWLVPIVTGLATDTL